MAMYKAQEVCFDKQSGTVNIYLNMMFNPTANICSNRTVKFYCRVSTFSTGDIALESYISFVIVCYIS